MGVSDWQHAAVGNWSRDVPYMLATTLNIENRRAWERDLLKFYLEALREAGGEAPTFDEAWTLYRQNLFTALAWWTGTLVVGEGQPEMQPREIIMHFLNRIGTAIDDLDAFDARW